MMFRTAFSAYPSKPLKWLTGWTLVMSLTCSGLGLTLALPVSAADTPPLWSQLSASEQRALQPLEGLWSTISADRKQKWREVASRFPTLSTGEQQRIRERMVDWAKMSPAERGAARLGFEQSKTLPASERQAGWDAYRALPEEQRKALATQATAPKPKAGSPTNSISGIHVQSAGSAMPAPAHGAIGAVQSKSNIVVTSPVQGRPVAPAVVQATVGASTRPVNQKPTPPVHHQPGQPKIAATPEFVNRTTLLPQRPAAPAGAQALQLQTANTPAAIAPSGTASPGSPPGTAPSAGNQ